MFFTQFLCYADYMIWLVALLIPVKATLHTAPITAPKLAALEISRHQNVFKHLKGRVAPYKFPNEAAMRAYIKQVAAKSGLSARLLENIVKAESSNCKFKVNTRSNDYGCMQINKATIKGYGWSRQSVLKNDKLGIWAGAIVLADFKKVFAKREPKTWPCRYNIGYRNLPKACSHYLKLIKH